MQNLHQQEIIKNLLFKDFMRYTILLKLRDYPNQELWVGGGFIRNLIWDFIHKYPINTELGDVDIFYFDPKNTDKNIDLQIERNLKSQISNVNWSVKNQARMHSLNDEPKYNTLEEAISKFPETASAIICRLNKYKDIEIIAPYGLEDLFNGVIRATEHFKISQKKIDRYHARYEQKKWTENWPNLIYIK